MNKNNRKDNYSAKVRFPYIRVSEEMNVKLEVECLHWQSKKSKEPTRVRPFIAVQVQEEKVETKQFIRWAKGQIKYGNGLLQKGENQCWQGFYVKSQIGDMVLCNNQQSDTTNEKDK
jgi:hypothetical protein